MKHIDLDKIKTCIIFFRLFYEKKLFGKQIKKFLNY